MKMIGCLFPHRRTMASSIARHKRARQGRVATEEPSASAWKFVRCPALIFFRWHEKRALSNLIVLAPANADEARQKLVYLIAVMVADPATPDAIGIANAIKSLKPFEATLAHCLSKRRTPFQ
ncbi:hypothetical protein [Allomesorhizobium camelthorni]|uniref:Uncharacterized protein n=1 Tax=Allomesorhizobium camelthorni TaxID=475069 RepID=A0A6G4WMB0_9HYPH|nr:hypothetical protein [Mesorhizobium camelthorni]NGO55323.1 hypothetical protein [Mesorhizobium camelthorni]